MATYKMLKTQRAVRPGDVHPSAFEEGKTYELSDDLAAQFTSLGAAEPSSEEPSEALPEAADLHENWLDTDPAVLRHGELTAKEVLAKDESDAPQTTSPAEQAEGKAEGEEVPDGEDSEEADGQPEGKSAGDAPENKKRGRAPARKAK